MIDIHSRNPYPSGTLSNFAANSFVFDGVPCASMEGLLQSLHYVETDLQTWICTLVGSEAKKCRQTWWKDTGKLYWKGKAMLRNGLDYQIFLDDAYNALATNQRFIDALIATGDEDLDHSIGHIDPSETILTVREFCSRLTKIRTRLKSS